MKSINICRKPTQTIQINTIKPWKEVELVIKTYYCYMYLNVHRIRNEIN